MSLSNFNEFRREPILALVQILAKTLVQFLKNFWPFLLFIILKTNSEKERGDDLVYFIIPIVVLFKSVIDYFFYRIKITDDEIQVKSGILSRKQILLAMHKIQTVHINQSWIQKIIGISELAFDSPGSSKAEIKIQLNNKDANELMSLILAKKENEISEDEIIVEEIISEFSFKDLLRLGLSSNHLETFIILIALGFSFLNNIKDLFDDFDGLMEDSTNQFIQSSLVQFLILLMLISIITILFSLVRVIITYANFRITKSINGFNISKGIFNSTQKLLPFKKIQYISWKTNWLQQKLSLYIYEFHTVGGLEITDNLKIKVPLSSDESIKQLSDPYKFKSIEEFDNNLKIHPSYWYRNLFFIGILPVLTLVFPLYWYLNDKQILLVLILPPIYFGLYFRLFYNKFQLSWNNKLIHVGTGAFGKKTILLKWNNIQSIKISQSLFQQKNNIANLIIHTAGGTIKAPYISLNSAQELQNIALYHVEQSVEPWH